MGQNKKEKPRIAQGLSHYSIQSHEWMPAQHLTALATCLDTCVHINYLFHNAHLLQYLLIIMI